MRPKAETLEEVMRQNARDIAITKRLGRGRPAPPPPAPDRGTTAERTARYPNPTTLAQRVALANQQIVWYNTEQGWFESYYTTAGEAGLTARGLRAGAAAGWYPITAGPRRRLVGTGTQAMSAGSSYAQWASTGAETFSLGTGAMAVSHVSGFALQVPIAGDYDVEWRLAMQSGAGTAVLNLWRYTPAPVGALVTSPEPLLGSPHQVLFEGTVPLASTAGAQYGLVVSSGDLFVGGNTLGLAQLEVRYTAPPFAS